jgi:hypothetical protein
VTAHILECSNFAVFAQDYKESQTGYIKGVIISNLFEAALMADEKPGLRLLDEVNQKAILYSHRAEESALLKLKQLIRRLDWILDKCSPLCLIRTPCMYRLIRLQQIKKTFGWSRQNYNKRTDGSKNGQQLPQMRYLLVRCER